MGRPVAEAPAGSIFVTAYGIWHRRMKSTAPGVRNLIKYWYVRTAEPKRDWIKDPDFELLDTMRSTDAAQVRQRDAPLAQRRGRAVLLAGRSA